MGTPDMWLRRKKTKRGDAPQARSEAPWERGAEKKKRAEER